MVFPSDLDKAALPLVIIPLQKSHIPMVSSIEKESFSQPWSEESFCSMLDSGFSFGWGAFDEKEVLLGYIIISYVAETGEILDIAVGKEYKRMGVGKALMDHAHGFLKHQGACEVFLEVRESNQAARCLYQKSGYAPVGIRKNYYSDPKENGLVMKKII